MFMAYRDYSILIRPDFKLVLRPGLRENSRKFQSFHCAHLKGPRLELALAIILGQHQASSIRTRAAYLCPIRGS